MTKKGRPSQSQHVEITGVKELDNYFSELRNQDKKKLIIDSWKQASPNVVQAAQSTLASVLKPPDNTGNLMESIGFIPGQYKTNSVFLYSRIGARRFRPFKGFHGHLVDAGTVERKTKKWGLFNRHGGANRGKMPATHFFTRAIDSSSPQFIAETTQIIAQKLDKAYQRHLKKTAKGK